MTSLEAALVMVPLFLMMLSLFDIARYFFTVQAMLTVMTETERAAMVSPLQRCGTGWWPNTASVAPLLDASQVYLCVGTVNGAGAVTQIQVTVQYPFAANFLTLLSGTLTETTTHSY
jgi:hypothetical protein